MKPLSHAGAEKQPPGVTAGRSDESFNFDDLSAEQGEELAQAERRQEEPREPREAKQEQQAAAARSPSPSALSTASSASPLIRSDSSSSSSSSTSRSQAGKQSAPVTGWRSSQQTGVGGGGPRRAHHLAPTSIAVAQLQQQQQRQQLATQQQQEKSKMSKFSSGNKLAQMAATTQQQISEPAMKKKKKSKTENETLGHHEGKSFGYNLGKMMAHRASRFNEFWSVNKMRYMNLACLLMTLVCLFTILLFSKSGGGGNQSLDTASQQQRLKQHHAHPPSLPQQQQQRHRFMAPSSEEQPTAMTMNGEDEQERPLESIDSIDRQPFVRIGSGASRKHALTMTMSGGGGGEGDDEQQAADLTTASGGSDTADGFNLFDETDSPATANGKRSLDDLLQDARRQLKRQQENEREAEESTTTTTTTTATSGSSTTEQQPTLDDKLQRKLAPINGPDPLLSRVLGDLDGFGLFKSIKSQLLEQLQQATSNGTGSERELFAAGKPIVRRGKNGATIIMSFGGSLLPGAEKLNPPVNGSVSTTTANATTSEQPVASLGSALERLLLPPPLAAILSGGKLPGAQGGFARITINAAEPTILRSSSGPFVEGPLPLFPRSFPFMPYESPMQLSSPARVFTSAGDSASSSTGAGGFMSMILRASSDLARQMDKQLSARTAAAAAAAANQSQAANKTINSTPQTQTEQLKPEASQQVKVTAAGNVAPLNATETTKDDDTEVETFDMSRMMMLGEPRLPRPLSPFHSLYSGARALRPPPMIMIGGGGGDTSSPFGLMPPPSAGAMLMMGGGGGGNSRGPPLSLGSFLSDVMSTMAREARGAAAGRRGDPETDTPTSSGPDDEDSSSSSWDEQPASSRLRSRHHSPEAEATDNSEREESEPTSHNTRRSSSSLLEHLLNGGGGPHTTRRYFGTIRQTFRGPDGVTVERVIDMPARLAGGRQFEVHAVPAGLRSQSISSRMDDDTERQDRAPAFARMMRELSDSSPFLGPRPLFAGSGLFGRELDSDATNEDENTPAGRGLERSDAAPLESQSSERSEDQTSDSQVPSQWRSEVKRVHIAGPRVTEQFPRHFSLPATSDERPQAHVGGQPEKSNHGEGPPAAHSSSSPSSPLFGFPALKPTFKSPQVVAGVTEPLTAAAAAAPTTSQRQPRAFVYHSNHEIATRQRPEQARARSTGESEPHAPVAPASASMVMGRRLDDFVGQRR